MQELQESQMSPMSHDVSCICNATSIPPLNLAGILKSFVIHVTSVFLLGLERKPKWSRPLYLNLPAKFSGIGTDSQADEFLKLGVVVRHILMHEKKDGWHMTKRQTGSCWAGPA